MGIVAALPRSRALTRRDLQRMPDDGHRYELLVAPFDVALDDYTVLQPDLLVARKSDFTAHDLPTAPLLAVGILSPSTHWVDLTLKRSRFESAGCRLPSWSSIP